MARGITHFGAFGADTGAGDVIACDAFQGSPVTLTGTADAIPQSTGGNFVITTGSADAITLPLPIAGTDDNLSLAIYSATNFAHTVTLPSAKLAPGVAVKTTATFPAFAGAGILLRAWNGTWQVVGAGGGTISYS